MRLIAVRGITAQASSMEAQRREMGRACPEWEEQEGTGAVRMPGSAASHGPL